MQTSSYLLGHSAQQGAACSHVSTSICIRKLVLVALGLSLLLQCVAISTRGWRIIYNDDSSYQEGLFFYVHCGRSNQSKSCETKSYSGAYFEVLDEKKSKDIGEREIHQQKQYTPANGRRQVGVMIAWFCSLISVFVLLKKYRNWEPVPITCSIFALITAVAGVIMGEYIYISLVNVGTDVRIDKLKNRSSVGFPYSLLFYILACTVPLISVGTLFRCLHNDITVLSQTTAETGPDNDINTLGQRRPDKDPDGDEINMQLFKDNRL